MVASGSVLREVTWRACAATVATFMALAAYVQVVYVCPSLLSLMVAISPSSTGHHVWRSLAGFHCSVCLVGAALIGIHMYMAGQPITLLQEEQGRELGGLLLVVLWLALCHGSHDRPGGGDARLVLAGIFAVLPILAWCHVHYNKSIQARAPAHCKHSL
uniref:transmembrane protein 220 isoform X2 n=1 Tax=Myxine glutinosa TaxID=7769 RepID=UPI00358ECC55